MRSADGHSAVLKLTRCQCAGADVAMSPQMPPLRRIFVWTGLILFLAIIFTYYIFEIRNIFRINDAIAEREAMRDEKRELVKSYQEKVEFYKTQEGIEHLAREQYNLVAPGERVILLVSPDE